jgi:hypothetical protein
VAEGLLDRQRAGRRWIYELTPSGVQALEARSEEVAALELRTGVRFDGAARLDGDLARFGARLNRAAPFVDSDKIAAILDAAADEVERLVPESVTEEEPS